MDITIKKIPSFNSAKRLTTLIPSYLTDKQLINSYAKIAVIVTAYNTNRLPDDYFNSALTASSSGYAPKDMWLIHNLITTKEELWKEIQKRNLTDFSVWDETKKSA